VTWDPRKTAGDMCHVWDCTATGPPLHGITRRCANGHRVTPRYCDDHITRMMDLAMRAPGVLPDGTFLGIPLCKECRPGIAELVLVLEGES
jgi:hypothetical protein